MKALAKDNEQPFCHARELFDALARALPQAFQPGFESDVAEYLEELIGASRHRKQGPPSPRPADAVWRKQGTNAFVRRVESCERRFVARAGRRCRRALGRSPRGLGNAHHACVF